MKNTKLKAKLEQFLEELIARAEECDRKITSDNDYYWGKRSGFYEAYDLLQDIFQKDPDE